MLFVVAGIKSFKRQVTKDEKMGKGFSFGDDDDVGELEDLDKLRDDLEATKQLLELEVRSKSLLEKDNKRLQAEIERLKVKNAIFYLLYHLLNWTQSMQVEVSLFHVRPNYATCACHRT